MTIRNLAALRSEHGAAALYTSSIVHTAVGSGGTFIEKYVAAILHTRPIVLVAMIGSRAF